jgi:hypothetical protein
MDRRAAPDAQALARIMIFAAARIFAVKLQDFRLIYRRVDAA